MTQRNGGSDLLASRSIFQVPRQRGLQGARDVRHEQRGPCMQSHADNHASSSLKQTPLYSLHKRLGGKLVPFAGYEMPVKYGPGVLKEHLHTRSAAGLFDVSHMGQISLRPNSGQVADAARGLERLVPQDIVGVAPGRQRYALLTNENGGILDDVMVANLGDHLHLIVNASRKDLDFEHLRRQMSDICTVSVIQDRALVSLQGPHAAMALARLAPECSNMNFMDARPLTIGGTDCIVTRSGYTGEDGFEISIAASDALAFSDALLNDPAVHMIGLGARDSLRLEAGLCLYGSDLDETTTPSEGALEWSIQRVRRTGGLREGGFLGSGVILDQLDNGASRRRVGLRAQGRAPVRGGALLFETETAGTNIGKVTSGGFGPSIGAPVAMGHVPASHAVLGNKLFADVRGNRLPVAVCALPFIAPNFKRG
jgi:aminomethyltransferase